MARATFHGSPTPSVTTTSPGRTHASAIFAASSSVGAQPRRTPLRNAFEHELPGYTGDGGIAFAEDRGHDRPVGDPESGAELTVEVSRPLVHVRLVDGDQVPRGPLARGPQCGRNLGRVVAVVVVDRDATPRADELEAPVDAGERRKHALGVVAPDSGELERCERRGSIPPVVLARHGQLERDRLELGTADDLRHLGGPRVEEGRELGLGCEGGMVVDLDVRDDCDLRPQEADRAVRLVSLDNEATRPGARVPAELRDDAADDPCGVVPELAEGERDHRRGRRLPVGATDDDRGSE